MAQQILRSLDEYIVKLERFGRRASILQESALRKSEDRGVRAYEQASRKLAGPDRRLSGVGRKGGYLAIKVNRLSGGRDSIGIEFKPGGPWSIRDNSISGGPTAARTTTAKNAKVLVENAWKIQHTPGLQGPRRVFGPGPVENGVGYRMPAFRNATQSIQPVITDYHSKAFKRAIADEFS